jgi:hypothetical protein
MSRVQAREQGYSEKRLAYRRSRLNASSRARASLMEPTEASAAMRRAKLENG